MSTLRSQVKRKDGFPRKDRHSENGYKGKFVFLLLAVAPGDETRWKR